MSWDTFNRVTGHATISAGINSTINGGSFGDAFKDSLLANIQGQVGKSLAGVIGDNGNALGEAGKTIAHGVTSGAIAEITGGKFAAGADRAETVYRYNLLEHQFDTMMAQAEQDRVKAGLGDVDAKARVEAREQLSDAINNLTLDLLPVVGDVKGFVEAQDTLDYALAAIAVIPGGDLLKGPLKAAKEALKAGDVETANKLLSGVNEVVPTIINGTRNLPIKDGDRLTEINKTLDRIDSGGPFPYKKDGTIFRNKEGKLPEGNYREYTVDTPGANNRGTRRVVQDIDTGRTYYTDDHYENFIQFDPTKR